MVEPTLCAVATPPGRGGIGVVRVSGPDAQFLAQSIAPPLPAPRYAALRRFRDGDGETLDEGLVLFFPGPQSFTGDDVVEFHGHGGPIVLDRLLQRLLALGAELAEPGAFSQRAFFNGRLDLTRAEAIADLIDAGSESAARAAMHSLQGEFANTVDGLVASVTALRVQLESGMDFADEALDGPGPDELRAQIDAVAERLEATRRAAGQGQRLQEGLTLVIAGRPNAGKSSLLNALAGRDAAIVTELAGTTRDILDTQLHIDGLPLRVLDTAGLRAGGDVVEQEGVRRARMAMAEADRILLVSDDSTEDLHASSDGMSELPVDVPVTRVASKIDLTRRAPGFCDGVIGVSARTGAGLDRLRAHLRGELGETHTDAVFIARRRHLQALDAAAKTLAEARAAAVAGLGDELVAESLRFTQDHLGEITGTVTNEDLLGAIFSTFCIGK